jgi:hypothetical protein
MESRLQPAVSNPFPDYLSGAIHITCAEIIARGGEAGALHRDGK